MSVKTVRFNKHEATMLKKILTYYRADFSSCVKQLLSEKLEDLADIGCIKKFRETNPENYLTAKEIDSHFKER